MAYNKFMDKAGNVLLDLTNDTVTEDDVLLGKTFHDKSGVQRIGTLAAVPEVDDNDYENDINRVNFFDYDGTLVASYSVEEAQQLTALPPLPDHTDDNLTSEGWTETLEFVNSLTRGFSIGITYHTTDGYTYVYMSLNNSSYLSPSLRIYLMKDSVTTIDWGDGSTEEFTATSSATKAFPHTYSSVGEYVIKIISTDKYYFYGSTSSSGYSFGNNDRYQLSVTKVRLSNQYSRIAIGAFYNCKALYSINITNAIEIIDQYALDYCYSLSIIITPNNNVGTKQYAFSRYGYALKTVIISSNSKVSISNSAFSSCHKLKFIHIPDEPNIIASGSTSSFSSNISMKKFIYPKNNPDVPKSLLSSCYNLEEVELPNDITRIQDNVFNGCFNLKEITIPNTVTSLGSSVFTNCHSLKKIKIPNSVTSIGNYAFQQCFQLEEVDLTAFEEPPALGSTNVFYDSHRVKLLISADVIEQFKAAPNWSTWTHLMVPVEVN